MFKFAAHVGTKGKNQLRQYSNFQGQVRDKPKVSEEKQQLRAPSGVYGQRVHPSRSPDEGTIFDKYITVVTLYPIFTASCLRAA